MRTLLRFLVLSVLMVSILFAGSSVPTASAAGSLDPRGGPVFAPADTPTPGWNALGSGLNSSVQAIAISGIDVYVGGNFTDAGGNGSADYIAKWNGTSWSALGSGFNSAVFSLAINGSNVYAGGPFLNAGGDANADHIARWNGLSWVALGSGLSGDVYAIAISGGYLYAGGYFTNAGGDANADHIAKWNGSSWSALGSGLNGAVFSIAISGTDVYVGGNFTDAGGDANADRIAKWNGSSWSALGSGLNDNVYAIVISGSNVYAGGVFTDAGGKANADHIAKWSGSSWSALGTGLNNVVEDIAISGSNVYAGGLFTDAGGKANADRIAKWNGSSWSALGSGLNDFVNVINISGSKVYAGGLFTDAGGKANADHIAFYYTPPTQTFLSQAANDGYILESSENSNAGGSMNSTANTFILGDDSQNRQYRSILSFDTSGLPDTATILSAVLKIKQNGSPIGTNPFTILGNLYVDIATGKFGSSAALELADFNAAASGTKVAYVNMTPTGGWYSAPLNAAGLSKINKVGLTQLRLYFNLDDNNNHVADYMRFISGNYTSNQPQLIITYTAP